MNIFKYSEAEKHAIATFLGGPYELITAIFWTVVAFGAMWAVFSPKVRDTTLERLALSFISICAFSRAFFVIERGLVPLDAMLIAGSLALYCIIIWWKHYIYLPKRRYNDFIERREGGKK